MNYEYRFWTPLAPVLAALLISGCNSSGDDPEEPNDPPPPPAAEYFVSGTVSGLSSDSLFVNLSPADSNSGFRAQQITVSGNSAFRFPQPIPDGALFTVWGSPPQTPPQRCDADNAKGRRIQGTKRPMDVCGGSASPGTGSVARSPVSVMQN